MKKQKNQLNLDLYPEVSCCSQQLANDKFRMKDGEIRALVYFTFYQGVLRFKERIWRTYKYPNRLRRNKDMMAVLTIDAVNTYKLMQSTGTDTGSSLIKFLATEFTQPIPLSLKDVAAYLTQKEITFERMLFA